MRLRPGAGLNPAGAGNVALNLPRTLALKGEEEVRVENPYKWWEDHYPINKY
ncbi:MAG: hypothetical protein QXT83_03285 [Sulfolobales archaeon]